MKTVSGRGSSCVSGLLADSAAVDLTRKQSETRDKHLCTTIIAAMAAVTRCRLPVNRWRLVYCILSKSAPC